MLPIKLNPSLITVNLLTLLNIIPEKVEVIGVHCGSYTKNRAKSGIFTNHQQPFLCYQLWRKISVEDI